MRKPKQKEVKYLALTRIHLTDGARIQGWVLWLQDPCARHDTLVPYYDIFWRVLQPKNNAGSSVGFSAGEWKDQVYVLRSSLYSVEMDWREASSHGETVQSPHHGLGVFWLQGFWPVFFDSFSRGIRVFQSAGVPILDFFFFLVKYQFTTFTTAFILGLW